MSGTLTNDVSPTSGDEATARSIHDSTDKSDKNTDKSSSSLKESDSYEVPRVESRNTIQPSTVSVKSDAISREAEEQTSQSNLDTRRGREVDSLLMDSDFTVMELAEFKEGFILYDRDHEGLIDIQDIAGVMRAIGQNPSNEIVERIKEDALPYCVEQECPETTDDKLDVADEETDDQVLPEVTVAPIHFIDFPDFIKLMVKWSQPVDSKEILLEAFRLFDKTDKGTLPEAELINILTSMSEIFSPVELDMFLEIAHVGDEGQVDYNKIADIMFAV